MAKKNLWFITGLLGLVDAASNFLNISSLMFLPSTLYRIASLSKILFQNVVAFPLGVTAPNFAQQCCGCVAGCAVMLSALIQKEMAAQEDSEGSADTAAIVLGLGCCGAAQLLDALNDGLEESLLLEDEDDGDSVWQLSGFIKDVKQGGCRACGCAGGGGGGRREGGRSEEDCGREGLWWKGEC